MDRSARSSSSARVARARQRGVPAVPARGSARRRAELRATFDRDAGARVRGILGPQQGAGVHGGWTGVVAAVAGTARQRDCCMTRAAAWSWSRTMPARSPTHCAHLRTIRIACATSAHVRGNTPCAPVARGSGRPLRSPVLGAGGAAMTRSCALPGTRTSRTWSRPTSARSRLLPDAARTALSRGVLPGVPRRRGRCSARRRTVGPALIGFLAGVLAPNGVLSPPAAGGGTRLASPHCLRWRAIRCGWASGCWPRSVSWRPPARPA